MPPSLKFIIVACKAPL